jgi:putative transposase
MHEWQSLSHVRWDCKYHVVIVPKYRKKVLYGKLRRQIGAILRELCRQRGVELVEGHAMPDHIHMCLSIPPKYSVAYVIGFLKGKSAVRIHREYLHERRMTGRSPIQPTAATARCAPRSPLLKAVIKSSSTRASRARPSR